MPIIHDTISERRVSRAALVLLLATACVSAPSTAPTSNNLSITLSSNASSVYEGDVFSMHALVRDGGGHEVQNAAVTWSSLDTSIARVNASGDVTSLKPGTARIMAKSGASTGTLNVDVLRLTVLKVAVLALPDTMGSGEVALYGVQVMGEGGRGVQGRPIVVTSSNPSVVFVDTSARVRAVSVGTATISATVDGVTGSTRVVVTNPGASP